MNQADALPRVMIFFPESLKESSVHINELIVSISSQPFFFFIPSIPSYTFSANTNNKLNQRSKSKDFIQQNHSHVLNGPGIMTIPCRNQNLQKSRKFDNYSTGY
jgi:hypothetical protein